MVPNDGSQDSGYPWYWQTHEGLGMGLGGGMGGTWEVIVMFCFFTGSSVQGYVHFVKIFELYICDLCIFLNIYISIKCLLHKTEVL